MKCNTPRSYAGVGVGVGVGVGRGACWWEGVCESNFDIRRSVIVLA